MARKLNFLCWSVVLAGPKSVFRRYSVHVLWSLKTTFLTTLSSSLWYYPFLLIQWATCCCKQYERLSIDRDTNNIEKIDSSFFIWGIFRIHPFMSLWILSKGELKMILCRIQLRTWWLMLLLSNDMQQKMS